MSMYVFAIFAASPAPIKESTKGADGRRPPASFVEAAEGRLLYMGVGFRVFGLSGHLIFHSDKLCQKYVTQLVQMDYVKQGPDCPNGHAN